MINNLLKKTMIHIVCDKRFKKMNVVKKSFKIETSGKIQDTI